MSKMDDKSKSVKYIWFRCECDPSRMVSEEAYRHIGRINRTNHMARTLKSRDPRGSVVCFRLKVEDISLAVERRWAHVSGVSSDGLIWLHSVTRAEWHVPIEKATAPILMQLAQNLVYDWLDDRAEGGK